jgi:hypothetical protein
MKKSHDFIPTSTLTIERAVGLSSSDGTAKEPVNMDRI